MSKLLFVGFNEPSGIPSGGTHGNQRNLMLMRDVFGKSNVDTYYVHPIGERQSLLTKARSVIGFTKFLHNGLTWRKIENITTIADQYDYIFLDTSLFGIIAKTLKEKNYKGKIISYFHNVEGIYYEARVGKYFPGRRIIIRCAAKNDEWTCRYADIAIALNNRDKNILEAEYKRKIDFLIPVSFIDEYHDASSDEKTSSRPLCTFVGSNFGPNREGILWFVENVLPQVNIKLRIVGREMDKLSKHLHGISNVEVVSNVPNLLPYYEETDFIISPIFSGSGMKVKTCEALMYGKNIIATKEAFEGYEIDPDKVGACCNNKEEFISAIDNFCRQPVKKYNVFSREYFLNKYSYDTILLKARHFFNIQAHK